MESICEGWLIKSPPEKRAQGRWKLFRAKWRRRYFVLYAPPAVDIIPGMCAAILDYYGGKALRHKHGTIDLTHCEEVLSQLDASFYQNVFGLRTKHKGRDRTYYLVAESESVMNEWVSSLCFVLGMKENVQTSVSSSMSGPLPQPPSMSLPSPSTSSLFNSVSSLPAPHSETLPFPHRGSGKRILSHSRVQSVPGINEAANTEMEEWQVRAPVGRFRPPLPSAARVVGTRTGHMTLRFVPSLPVIGSEQGNSCMLSSASAQSSIFTDSLLSENSLSGSTEYDHPRQSYYHKIPSSAVNSKSFSGNTSNFCSDFYSMPSRSTPSTSEQDNVYKIPRSKGYWQSDIGYDVPASARQSYDVPAKCPGQHTVTGEHYDVPLLGIPVPCFPSSCQGENGSNSESPDDVIESSHLLSVLQSLINELPSVDISENHLVQPPGVTLGDQTSAMELLLLSTPPKMPNNTSQHPQTNSGSGNGDVSSSDNSSSMPDQNLRPVSLPRHPAYNQVPTANDPICFTHRSRSFKRSIERADNEKSMPLLMKKISDISESSSLSDDEEPFDVFHSDCSNEMSSSPKQSIYDVPVPTSNFSKDSEISKYLGLTAVPISVKFCKAVQPRRRIHYKDIDWCKTKTLSEIKREVEDKRTNHW